MRLASVHIKEFQSIRDANEFEVGDVTCLVGKNEAGKTALLKALYRLNPIVETEGRFDVTDDYPRADVENYRQAVDEGKREEATVVRVTYRLDDDDLQPVVEVFGPNAVKKPTLTLSKGYADKRTFVLEVDDREALTYLLKSANLPADDAATLTTSTSVEAAIAALANMEQTAEVQRVAGVLGAVRKRKFNGYIFDTFLTPREPRFLYFDEYYQMKGRENIEALSQRKNQGTLEPADHPMLGLIELARLDFKQLLNPDRTQELVNKLEAAGNHLTKTALKYWSQNRHLMMRFDVRPARPGDPEGMRQGSNIWASVYDTRHLVTTGLSARSRGFVWFFSFLAWYSQVKKKDGPLVLLLDEPGLSLHAKAQEDLLRFFEKEVKGAHQLLYTTHSPFMVDAGHFDRVRIVQDKGIDATVELPAEEDGTKVLTDVLEASGDSLFPLQGALGYEIYQTLFVGPNSLVVEGVSDLLYLQTMSGILESIGRTGLDSKWTITPVGGSDKVPTFVALIGAQKGLKIATLIDFQKKDQQTIENLFKKKLLNKNYVVTYADFTGTAEADVEDLFEPSFYLDLVNAEFGPNLANPIAETDLDAHLPRIVVRLEKYFAANPMTEGVKLSHFRPARYLTENSGTLAATIPAATLDRYEKVFERLNRLI